MPGHRTGWPGRRPVLGVAVAGVAVVGVAAVLAAGVPAQNRVVVQLGGPIQVSEGVTDDRGPEVEMFESPNLDRFLRRASQFLAEEQYRNAILILQTVIEGRTLEASGLPGMPEVEAPADAEGAGADEGDRLADPSQTVFSADGRIYRPARRLCHEYLASLPASAIELYQALYEAQARELLETAVRTGLVSDLERVANHYFVTLSAGRAMQVLADRLMHEGRYRAAVQVLRDLAELYPMANQQRLGISQLWCRFKIALCLRLCGEVGAALEAAEALAAEFPDESLRVMGVLHAVRDLPRDELFDRDGGGQFAELAARGGEHLSWLTEDSRELVPLWQFRFAGPDPYAVVTPRRSNDNSFVFGEAVVTNAAPPANKYGTGTQILFTGGGGPPATALFLEHFRLRVADAFTGLLRQEGDADNEPPPPREMRPRARVPAYDFTLQTPVEDAERYYVIVGYDKITQGVDALKENRVVAYDKATCERVWSSDSFREGEDGLDDVTFLAAPTVFGERLLAPVLHHGAYSLQCLDRSTGEPLWRTRIHSGGTTYFKAPGAPVLVLGSMAYMLTNAGCLAAVDAFAGDLRWIRKYERDDPLRQPPVGRGDRGQSGRFVNMMTFVERDLPSFLPSRMVAAGGTLVFAGCDSNMLMCVDGASGEPIWMIDGSTRYAPYGRIRYLIGANSRNLYCAAEGEARAEVVCIGLSSGLIRWAREVPGSSENLTRWRGRGCVLEDFVVMPGDREVHVLDAEGQQPWRRLDLPSFSVGDEPLRGPNNLFAAGPWLGVCYAQGLEVYSTESALSSLAATADEPLHRADLLVQAGRMSEALDVVTAMLDGELDAEVRARAATKAVALARELALRESAVAPLDRVRKHVESRPVRLAWHLARLDFYQRTDDLRAYQAEQQRLYRVMEGKD